MLANEILNKRYAKLCESLGDLEMNRDKLNARISEVKREILAVESMLPLAERIELEVRESVRENSARVNDAKVPQDQPVPSNE